MFNYDYFADFVRKLVVKNYAPLQVELQPGKGCCGYNCKFCYGYGQKLTAGRELTAQEYDRLLDDIKGRTGLITLAGIRSDPLDNKNIYRIIKKIKENGFRLGIHTKGFLLNERISDLLNTRTAYGDFMTFSIDAPEKTLYNRLHALPEKSGFFDTVRKNIEYIYRRKRSSGSALNINVSYLLFKENSSKRQMNDFVRTFGNFCDTIRFSPSQLPNKAAKKPDYYLDSLAGVRRAVEDIKKRYPDKRIVFLDFKNQEHKTRFKYCYAQRFLAVIDRHGFVFGCPQITTAQFKSIAYGNIKDKGFWQIWQSRKRSRILDMEVDAMKCRICDRKDEAVNIELSRIFDDKKAC